MPRAVEQPMCHESDDVAAASHQCLYARALSLEITATRVWVAVFAPSKLS
jgi:hypothetical protein